MVDALGFSASVRGAGARQVGRLQRDVGQGRGQGGLTTSGTTRKHGVRVAGPRGSFQSEGCDQGICGFLADPLDFHELGSRDSPLNRDESEVVVDGFRLLRTDVRE